uniref:Uncharacterized protein n=1 Tax=Romanomermis culicivorax TaxID=13658 RepID=A0A915HH83_ROMCU
MSVHKKTLVQILQFSGAWHRWNLFKKFRLSWLALVICDLTRSSWKRKPNTTSSRRVRTSFHFEKAKF